MLRMITIALPTEERRVRSGVLEQRFRNKGPCDLQIHLAGEYVVNLTHIEGSDATHRYFTKPVTMTSLSTKLAEREASGKPIQIGLIGAGKFGSMLYVRY